MRYQRSALEAQLEVTRLARRQKEAERGDLYDNLHDEIKQQVEEEEKKKQQQAEENPVEETTDDTEADDDTATETDGDTASDDSEDTTNESKESSDSGDAAKDDTKSKDSDDEAIDEAKDGEDDVPPAHSAKEDKTDEDAKVQETDDTGKKGEEAVAAESHGVSVALEFFSSGVHDTIRQFIALEDQYVPKLLQDNKFNEHKLTGVNNGYWIEEHMPYVAELGFKYGGLLLKHVYRGVLFALDATIKGLFQGSQHLVRSVKNAIESYERQSKALDDLAKALDALAELPDIENRKIEGEYHVKSVIQQLKIDETVDPTETLDVAIQFSEAYIGNVGKAVKNHLYTTQKLIDSVVEQKLKMRPEAMMREQMQIPGFKNEVVDGYEVPNEHCDSFAYQEALPGDMRFIAFLPSHNVKDRDGVMNAYHAAKMLFGVSHQDIEVVESMPYLDRDGIEKCIDQLQNLCKIGLKQRQLGPEIIRQRSDMKKSLMRYLGYLATANHRISIEDSYAEYIALRSRGLDKTYLSGLLLVQDYQRKVIAAGIRYVEACIKAHKDTAPVEDSEDAADA